MSWGGQLHVSGGVYTVIDEKIRLLPAGERYKHPTRPFLVLSPTAIMQDDAWPVVVGCPLSTSDKWHTEYDVEILKGVAGLESNSWVRVPAIQPIEKDDLDFFKGQVPGNLLVQVRASIAAYCGLF